MDKTIQKIKKISLELVSLIDASQRLEKLANMARTEFEDIVDLDIVELVDLADQKVEARGKEIKSLVEEILPLVKLYLALTTPFEPNPYSVLDDEEELEELDEDESLENDKVEEIENELEGLYRDYKELVSIGPDPIGYDRSYEAEKSRLEDKIGLLEDQLLNEDPFEN